MSILSAIATSLLRILLVQAHWLSVDIVLSVGFRYGPPMQNSIFSLSSPITKGFTAKAFRCFLLTFGIFDLNAHGIRSAAQWHQGLGIPLFIISFLIQDAPSLIKASVSYTL